MTTRPGGVLLILAATCLNCVAADMSKLAAANNSFAFKLLNQLAAERPGSNTFVSPYSAATALQMVLNGAANETKQEMMKALEVSGFNATELAEANRTAASLLNPRDKDVILTTANALWYRQNAGLKPAFMTVNEKSFGATIRALDFSDAAKAEATINQWAREQTSGRVDGIANGMIHPVSTDLILANAIYFKGRWLDPFDSSLTEERPFHLANSATRNLPMMQLSQKFMYREGTGYQAVRLPYLGNDLAMYVFLPNQGSSPEKLLSIMHGANWSRITMPGFKRREGSVALPKFKLVNTLTLNSALKALGMKSAFNPTATKPAADFSGMFNEPHCLSEVRQKAFVEVSEEGTEAAAVTEVGVTVLSATPINRIKPFEMIVDRPFLFAIVDARSEIILFLGLVNELY